MYNLVRCVSGGFADILMSPGGVGQAKPGGFAHLTTRSWLPAAAAIVLGLSGASSLGEPIEETWSCFRVVANDASVHPSEDPDACSFSFTLLAAAIQPGDKLWLDVFPAPPPNSLYSIRAVLDTSSGSSLAYTWPCPDYFIVLPMSVESTPSLLATVQCTRYYPGLGASTVPEGTYTVDAELVGDLPGQTGAWGVYACVGPIGANGNGGPCSTSGNAGTVCREAAKVTLVEDDDCP